MLEQSGDDGAWIAVGRGETAADGRLRTLVPESRELPSGTYRLVFDTARYFEMRGTSAFYPFIVVVFEVRSTDSHYHVPLLLSPFGYSTYRGS